MVTALVPRSGGPGASPGQGHSLVFLGKTLYFHGASLHPNFCVETLTNLAQVKMISTQHSSNNGKN